MVESCQTFDNIEAIFRHHEYLSHTRRECLKKYQELPSHYASEEIQLSVLLALRKSHLIDSMKKYNERISKFQQIKRVNEYRNTTLIKDVQRVCDKNTELSSVKIYIKMIYARALSRSSNAAI
jgi:hypothetical protein